VSRLYISDTLQFCLLFLCSYNSLLNVQNLYSYNNFYFPYLLPWYMLWQLLVTKTNDVKNKRSGLNIFLFSFLIFILFFYLFSFILFLELGLGLEWQNHAVTQAGHIRWHGHKLHDTGKDVEGSGRMTSYNV